MSEYRVIWQRKGQSKKRELYQTPGGAQTCAERQKTAAKEMDWLPEPLPPIVFGPIVEVREVGPWTSASSVPREEKPREGTGDDG